MPYTRIELTCETCGKTFEHRHNCMKSRDIENYNAWAIKNVTECPECYKQSCREAKAAKMHEEKVIIRISYRDYKNGCELDAVPNSYDPETKTIEVAIERERAMDIALLAKSDDELAKTAVKKGVATETTAEEYVKSAREKADKFYRDVIGKNWKTLIEKYADQLPEIELEEETEAEEETETEEEVEKNELKTITVYTDLRQFGNSDDEREVAPCYLTPPADMTATKVYIATLQIPNDYEIKPSGAHGEVIICDSSHSKLCYHLKDGKFVKYISYALCIVPDDNIKIISISEG